MYHIAQYRGFAPYYVLDIFHHKSFMFQRLVQFSLINVPKGGLQHGLKVAYNNDLHLF